MFTGIVTAIGSIVSVKPQGDLTLAIACPWDDLRVGESVAVNGACLTVMGIGGAGNRGGRDFYFPDPPTFTLSAETLARTAPRWAVGARVNLERALKLGDRLDGHLVSGHVDGLATIAAIAPQGDSHILTLDAPPALARFIAEKGSVTLDGVSLTVNNVEDTRFSVNVIPHTWEATTLGDRKAGDAVNLEVDMMARYAARLMDGMD